MPAGSTYGFLGPNGAGKTTTLRMVMNILTPDAGSISVLGILMGEHDGSRHAVRSPLVQAHQLRKRSIAALLGSDDVVAFAGAALAVSRHRQPRDHLRPQRQCGHALR